MAYWNLNFQVAFKSRWRVCAGNFVQKGMSTTLTLFSEGRGPLSVLFFPSSTRGELLEGIREAIGAPAAGSPLRFLDEDGEIVIIAPTMPPCTLHVKVEAGFPYAEALGGGGGGGAPAAVPRFELCKPGSTLSASGAAYTSKPQDMTQSWWALSWRAAFVRQALLGCARP